MQGAVGNMANQARQGITSALNSAKGSKKGAEKREHFDKKEGKIIIPTKVVQDSFRKVFLENLAVLAMFFLLIGMLVLSYMGPESVDAQTGQCTVNGTTKSCGYVFFFLPAVWSFMYLQCSCCANKVSIAKEEMGDYDKNYEYQAEE